MKAVERKVWSSKCRPPKPGFVLLYIPDRGVGEYRLALKRLDTFHQPESNTGKARILAIDANVSIPVDHVDLEEIVDLICGA